MKKSIYFFLFFLFLFTGIKVALAQTAVKPAGSGTASDPYQIATLDNLYWLSQADTAWGRYYVQTADINAADTKNWDSGNGFSPIGSSTEYFTGRYDGQGHTIDNLYMNTITDENIGLFGITNNAEISNLGILNVRITGSSGELDTITSIGGLVGLNYSSTVSNSYSTGIIINADTITNALGVVGGLVGSNISGTVSNSYSTGIIVNVDTVTLGGGFVGGLVGVNMGIINTSYSRGYIKGYKYDINGCFGGLVGINLDSINNSYSRDSLMLGSSSSSSSVGGLVGINADFISNSYSTGLVIGDWNAVGGLVGSDSIGWVINNTDTVGYGYANNSFWDTQTSGQSNSAGGTGETTADMKTKSTFTNAGWDFTTIWNIDPNANDGYPYLIFNDTTGISNSLVVDILPQDAVNAGAQWNVDDGSWQNSGDTVNNLAIGNHTVNFKNISGWKTPSSQKVTINTNQTILASGTYTPLSVVAISSKIQPLANGPSEDLYQIPENGTGYVYFSMTDSTGQPLTDTMDLFTVSLSDQTNKKFKENTRLIKPGVLQIAIPGSQLSSNFGVSNSLTIQDSIQIGDTLYLLSKAPPTFNVAKAQENYTHSFDFFADGSAGVTGELGGVGVGPVSVAAVEASISGTAGMGLNISVDPNNNLTLSRRFEYGVNAGLEIPSVNFVVGQISGFRASRYDKTMTSEDMSTNGIEGLTSNQVNLAQAGFVLETLSMGIGNFSPTLGPFLKSIQNTLLESTGIEQTLNESLVKKTWGLDDEGEISAGLRANLENITLNVGNASISGELSARYNSYPKGVDDISNADSSISIAAALKFDLSALSFSFDDGGVSLEDGDLGLINEGTGMEAGAEAYFDNSNKFLQLNLWTEGGNTVQFSTTTPTSYLKTEYEIPGEYQNLLEKNNFGIDGLIMAQKGISFAQLPQDFVQIIDTTTSDFIQDHPITIKIYNNTGTGFDRLFGVDLSAVLGVGGGLKLGAELEYYNEVSYLNNQALLYGNNDIYLMSTGNYSNQMDSYQVSTFFNSMIKSSAVLVKTAFLNLVNILKKEVSSGANVIMKGVNNAGKFVGYISGTIQQSGQLFLSTFSPNYEHLWKQSFAEPVVQNLYYSTKVQHKETSNNKTVLVNINTTMVAVSNNINVSFIPDGQTVSVDSVDSSFTIKMLIDTAILRKNGFTLADSSRIKIYRYNDSNGNWILVGGTLHGDTLEASTKYMENYLLGIELTDADDKMAPTIVDYGPTQDSTYTSYPTIYAQIQDNQYGVGVNWNKTFLIANGDTLDASFDPTDQKIFYKLSANDSLSGEINIKVWTEDYNGNSDSITFPIKLVITGIQEEQMNNGFRLNQNYPNPFSSMTKITYSLPKPSNVKIMIFNSTGGYITTLKTGFQSVGNHSVEFNGTGLPSGIYFYSFVAVPVDGSPGYRETRKMNLIKGY